ncbi:MAG: ABC transporter ATP-binding protein [Acidobacteria bacterium]|nr:MAG: ABC transporter ATP-binding protein [Acidobacteriota bacterium]
MSHELTLGSLVSFLLYAQRFFRPVADISEKLNGLQAAIAAAERIFGLIDTKVEIESPKRRPGGRLRPEIPAEETGRQAGTRAGTGTPRPALSVGAGLQPCSTVHIRFDRVSFAYDGRHDVLRNVSFDVAPGERVGIVGATGSGKSTLVNLLLRFYDVRQGRILLDGVDIRRLGLEELRSIFGLVLQDVQLFSGSISSNVRFGDPRVADEAVREAVASVGAAEFVEGLPGGLESPVAERGSTLSTGQKQLISFARALAFNRPVLVLDEATASVDTGTELMIRAALDVAMAGRTTIAIAHRLSTVQTMDKILVMHKGELREMGPHSQLLARRGLYYRLWQLQYREGDHQAEPERAER